MRINPLIIAFLAAVLIVPVILSACGKTSNEAVAWNGGGTQHNSSSTAEGAELFCLADTEEEAEEIAELYDIELVSYSNGVAVFHTEENPNDVIEKGKANNWPLLETNHTVSAH